MRRDAKEAAAVEQYRHAAGRPKSHRPPKVYKYVDELAHLQFELIKLQEWVRLHRLEVAVIFEGRDAAGKGGVIKRITQSLNPRICRVVALGTQKKRKRYVAELPTRGEIVLFDRSWYNRAGVERVMEFCSEDEYQEFLRSCPVFGGDVGSLGHLSHQVLVFGQRRRARAAFPGANRNPIKRWKLSPMDVESRKRSVGYSKAKDVMFEHTDRKKAPWHVVDADDKKRDRLNCIQIPYQEMRPVQIETTRTRPTCVLCDLARLAALPRRRSSRPGMVAVSTMCSGWNTISMMSFCLIRNPKSLTHSELTRRGIATARDGTWSATSVVNVRRRLKYQQKSQAEPLSYGCRSKSEHKRPPLPALLSCTRLNAGCCRSLIKSQIWVPAKGFDWRTSVLNC